MAERESKRRRCVRASALSRKQDPGTLPDDLMPRTKFVPA